MKPSHKAKGTVAPTTAPFNTHSQSELQFSAKSTATEAQRSRVLDALAARPHTTLELREMGILMPAPRIKELRDQFGFHIDTSRVTIMDRQGFVHVGVALYSLVAAKQEQRA